METAEPRRLPFEHSVEAIITVANRTYIMVSRNDAHRPFVVYTMCPGGGCVHGSYKKTRTDAFAELFRRVERMLGTTIPHLAEEENI